MNASTNLPGGMTRADYNRLFLSKVEFVRVSELPTSDIKEYPTIYILLKDNEAGVICEYDAASDTWLKYGGELGIVPITGEAYDALSEEDKNKDVFYLITDRIAYLEDVAVFKGATSSTDGTVGIVPAPVAGDQAKFLRGDGAWTAALPLAGGTMTGSLNFANHKWNNVGDDVAIGDHDAAGSLGVKGLNGNPKVTLFDKSGNTMSVIGSDISGEAYSSGNFNVKGTTMKLKNGAANIKYNATTESVDFVFS